MLPLTLPPQVISPSAGGGGGVGDMEPPQTSQSSKRGPVLQASQVNGQFARTFATPQCAESEPQLVDVSVQLAMV